MIWRSAASSLENLAMSSLSHGRLPLSPLLPLSHAVHQIKLFLLEVAWTAMITLARFIMGSHQRYKTLSKEALSLSRKTRMVGIHIRPKSDFDPEAGTSAGISYGW